MLHFQLSFALLSVAGLFVMASPTVRSLGEQSSILQPRTDPFFPSTPASCPICAQNYAGINSCAAAAPVLANFTNIIFNPGAFVDVIKCACTDTFQSAYPQCADCFIQTNQSQVLNYNTQDLPGIITGMRNICALESTLLGNVSVSNGEVTPVTSTPLPSPTSGTAGNMVMGSVVTLFLLVLSVGHLNFIL